MPSDKSKREPSAEDTRLKKLLDKNQDIKDDVSDSGDDLKQVNRVMAGEEMSHGLQAAYSQNKITEENVARSALELSDVNHNLAREIDVLAEAKEELVEAIYQLGAARDDLAESRQRTDESRRQIPLDDPLTKLPNRLAFEKRLELSLSQARRHKWRLAIFSMDVDQFKGINDSHGHEVGDEVLQMVAARMALLRREDDMVSRWGGDEFVCLMLDVGDHVDVMRMAKEMVERIAEPYVLHQEVLRVQVSLGIAIFPDHGSSAEVLLRHADLAMYQAKGQQERVVFFQKPEPA